MSLRLYGARLSGVLLLAALLAGPTACTVRNPLYCDDAGLTCVDPLICQGHGCVPKDFGSGGSGGTGADASIGAGDAIPDSPVDGPRDQNGSTTEGGSGGTTGDGGGDVRDSGGATDTAPDRSTDTAMDTPPEIAPRCTQTMCALDPSKPFCDNTDAGTCTNNCALASPDPCGTVTDGGQPHCDPASQACVTCLVNADCTGAGKPYCKQSSHQCVACLQDIHCTTGNNLFCVSDACTTCMSAASTACAIRDSTNPVCRTDNQVCGQCNVDSDCSSDPARPICLSHMCSKCTTDAQCAGKLGPDPGVCMAHQNGRCATPAETIYVQATTAMVTCSNTGTNPGTVAAPVCDATGAFPLITANRRLIVIRGALTASFSLSFTGAPTEVSVVGQKGANILNAPGPGISISGAPVYLRGLTVEMSLNIGIIIEGSPLFRMDRVTVLQNTFGGLRVRTSGFDVTNSIFNGNGGSRDPDVGYFGGAYLDAAPTGMPHHFAFNTVYTNAQVGVVVVAAPSPTIIIASLLSNNVGGDTDGMTLLSKTSLDGNPMITPSPSTPTDPPPLHLTATSSCRDFISASQLTGISEPLPLFDIDGDPRPQGPASAATKNYDCGADEFLVP